MPLSISYLYRRRKHHERTAPVQRPVHAIKERLAIQLAPPPVPLLEVSFKQLINATDRNGQYLQGGGMRRVAGRWIIDPSIPGRTSNSRFVVTTPPKVRREQDGCVSVIFNFKSRPDRATTGLRQRGYVKFLPDKRAKYQFGNKVHVFCTCPDFKYRSHKVLSDMGASHTPTGIGGEATNADPVVTNPSKLPFMCKHLVAVAAYLSARRTDYNAIIKKLGGATAPAKPKEKPATPTPTTATHAPADDKAGLQKPQPEKPEDKAAATSQTKEPAPKPAPAKKAAKPADKGEKGGEEVVAVPKATSMRKDQSAAPEDEENLDIEKTDSDEESDKDKDLT